MEKHITRVHLSDGWCVGYIDLSFTSPDNSSEKILIEMSMDILRFNEVTYFIGNNIDLVFEGDKCEFHKVTSYKLHDSFGNKNYYYGRAFKNIYMQIKYVEIIE